MQKNKPVVSNENIEIAILGYFAAYPRISTRKVALESGISQGSIPRILRKHPFHPYIFFKVHFKETYFSRRVECCKFSLLRSQEDVFFFGLYYLDG